MLSRTEIRRSNRPENRPHTGAMLRVVSNWVRDEIYAAVIDEGFRDLNPAHLAMFRYPGLDGMAPSRLAADLQITKQAVNSLVGYVEQCGYIVREMNPTDARGRVIRLTPKGRDLESAVHAHARRVEMRISDILGPEGLTKLRSELERLFDHVIAADDA